jgi:UDP-N-acetylglucosamine 1-carboxyvinyltransferase
MPDRIAAGTYLVAAAMTDGDITLTGVNPDDMQATTQQLEAMGCELTITADSIRLTVPRGLRAASFETAVYPGVPTDMQAQLTAALCVAEGRSLVVEKIFSARFSHLAELAKMGAQVAVASCKQTAMILGCGKLRAATVAAHDLRCGAALICAAVAAEGVSTIRNIHFVERGYENIVDDLRQLGVEISLYDAATEGSLAE